MILLSIFTLVEAYTLGVVCASLQRSGAGDIVLQAFIITAAIFIGLTIFTLQRLFCCCVASNLLDTKWSA
jgi:FtsH-binding integral membrane protein